MTMQEEITGLCVNCNFKEGCIYSASAKDPVVCCEEFDSYIPVQQLPPENSDFKLPVDDINNSNGFTGLCINCDNNSVCEPARVPGGVWHCEEYQ